MTHGGADLSEESTGFVNMAVSWPGLDKLGAFDTIGGVDKAEQAFHFDFKDPPDADSLRSYGASAPDTWWNKRFTSSDVDLTVHTYCKTPEKLATVTEEVRQSARRNHLEELIPTQDGETLTGHVLQPGLRTLHFGYQDGFSQPRVNWDDDPSLTEASPPVYPRGHFIIDDWDKEAQSFPRHDPWRSLVRHSSYLSFAWIHQDVAKFNRFLRENAPLAAPHLGQADAEELLAAKMLGRWRDGTPLVLSPNRRVPHLAEQDFNYAADADGSRCPIGAHIRIVNGRDRPLDVANQLMFPKGFPRVLRRGSSYGPPLDGEIDDGQDRGILGMFLCSNINKQFYSLTRWIGATDFSADYVDQRGQDPLFANRAVPNASNNFVFPTATGPVTLKGLPAFIRYQGVVNLLLPSLPTLQRLAS